MAKVQRIPHARFTTMGSDTGDRRLPQVLAWDTYHSPRRHELELERLYRPSWQCIGIKDEIPKEGDYFTIEHFGRPLVIQNQGDRVAVFHNICAHRNALLARQPRGNMPRLKCGYHGWEYDRDGVACRIPGGEYFKPMKPKEFALDRARVEVIGRLIFVTLDESAPPLEEFLGPEVSARLARSYGPSVDVADVWTVDYECNWKVLLENTLEDYHITTVHYATVGETPPYPQIEHMFGGNYIRHENRTPDFANRRTRWMARLLGADAEFTYFMYVSYPGLILALTPLSSHLHVVTPTSATTCRAKIYLFLAGGHGRPLGRLLFHLMRKPAVWFSRKFTEEDRLLCNDAQRGVANARFPGALGCREELVHHFQEYIAERCADVRIGAEEGEVATRLPVLMRG